MKRTVPKTLLRTKRTVPKIVKKCIDKVSIMYIMDIYIIDGDENEYNNK